MGGERVVLNGRRGGRQLNCSGATGVGGTCCTPAPIPCCRLLFCPNLKQVVDRLLDLGLLLQRQNTKWEGRKTGWPWLCFVHCSRTAAQTGRRGCLPHRCAPRPRRPRRPACLPQQRQQLGHQPRQVLHQDLLVGQRLQEGEPSQHEAVQRAGPWKGLGASERDGGRWRRWAKQGICARAPSRIACLQVCQCCAAHLRLRTSA